MLKFESRRINKLTYQTRVIDPIYQTSTDRGTSFSNSPGLWICNFFFFFFVKILKFHKFEMILITYKFKNFLGESQENSEKFMGHILLE